MMTHLANWSWKLKIAAGVVGVSVGTLGVHAPYTGATEDSYVSSHMESESNRDSRIQERRTIEADSCRASNDHGQHDDGDSRQGDDRGRSQLGASRNDDSSDDHGGGGDDHNHHPDPNPPPSSGMVLQTVTVSVHATDLLKVDRRGRVVEAATNTGCVPRQGDDVFLLLPNGSVVQTADFDLKSCQWLGDFRLPGVFQPQSCNAEHGKRS
jgi:hypothetical protein